MNQAFDPSLPDRLTNPLRLTVGQAHVYWYSKQKVGLKIPAKNTEGRRDCMSDRKTISRREFMKKAGTVGAAVALSGGLTAVAKTARAQKREFILIGHPNPSTGPIASFGEASPRAA